MQDSAFSPQVGGQTFLVGVTRIQVPAYGGQGNTGATATSYRVRCLVSGYLQFAVSSIAAGLTTAPTMSAGAPADAVPVTNTIGMTAGQTEVFDLPMNCWFLSSVAAGFEVTPGEGV